MHKYKNTNTQIQHKKKCQKDPTCGIFLKRGLVKDIKNYILMCLTGKWQRDQDYGIFMKRGLIKDFKNNNPMCQMHKYKNTSTKFTRLVHVVIPYSLKPEFRTFVRCLVLIDCSCQKMMVNFGRRFWFFIQCKSITKQYQKLRSVNISPPPPLQAPRPTPPAPPVPSAPKTIPLRVPTAATVSAAPLPPRRPATPFPPWRRPGAPPLPLHWRW